MRFSAVLTVFAILGLTTACTGDDPVETGFGTASAAVTDDTGTNASSQSSEHAAVRTEADGHFSGTFSSSAEVEISADGETWVELGAPSSIMVALQSDGEESTVHSNASIPVGTYTRVRLTLSGAQAEIDAGATLGGVTLTSSVTLDVGGTDGQVVIEKEVQPFTVSSDTHVRVLFDLNSELWVNEQNADDEEVEDEEVRTSSAATRDVEERDS